MLPSLPISMWTIGAPPVERAAEADAEPTQASITMREKCLMDV